MVHILPGPLVYYGDPRDPPPSLPPSQLMDDDDPRWGESQQVAGEGGRDSFHHSGGAIFMRVAQIQRRPTSEAGDDTVDGGMYSLREAHKQNIVLCDIRGGEYQMTNISATVYVLTSCMSCRSVPCLCMAARYFNGVGWRLVD